MNVALTPEMERRIAEKVASGLYASPSEVVREGLRLLFETEEQRDLRLQRLRAEIQVGLDELDRGQGIAGEIVLATVTERLERRREL